ncbi:MAG TPA: thioredoxin domain-containing protein [Anaeromyxobacteraceae bacterium]|nr:thioredoxin domain-containing protein [Anaeromyxobacteraceae bacterium]
MRKLLPLVFPALCAAAWVAIRTAPARAAAADVAELLPGIPVEQLTPTQRQTLAQVARDEYCYCGCPHTLAQCLATHRECRHAPRMAQLAARLAGTGMPAAEIAKQLSAYYSSFEKGRRARLDLAAFGPPQGAEKAPVALVEFSDFTCPYCQLLKPVLDDFVKGHASRLRLYYKPFPIQAHPRAAEAALAGEWARDAGLFWKMYDALFAHPHELSDEDLADRAREIGGDPTALRAALQSGKLKARVAASQAEGRAAGMLGTPTLYFNGRRYVLADMSPSGLEFTLEDEEEWTRNGGWARD